MHMTVTCYLNVTELKTSESTDMLCMTQKLGQPMSAKPHSLVTRFLAAKLSMNTL